MISRPRGAKIEEVRAAQCSEKFVNYLQGTESRFIVVRPLSEDPWAVAQTSLETEQAFLPVRPLR